MVAAIIIGIIVLIIIINVSSSNRRREREKAERQSRLKQQKEETERQTRLKQEREDAEKKKREQEQIQKQQEELKYETVTTIFATVDENGKPIATIKRDNNTYAFVERPSEEFVLGSLKLLRETTSKFTWIDEKGYVSRKAIELQIVKKLEAKKEVQRQKGALLEQFGINYLYHMTHRNNLEKILQVGLKSHNDARKNNLMQNDIANNDVNGRRSRIEPINNRNLHDYVPLYFNPKNPMLYVQNMRNDIVILAIDKMLIYDKDTVFTDGNAANRPTKFFNDTNKLNQLNWECIRAEYWSDFEDGKRERMAEILVFPNISATSIQKIYSNNLDTFLFIQEKTRNYQYIESELNRNLYF